MDALITQPTTHYSGGALPVLTELVPSIVECWLERGSERGKGSFVLSFLSYLSTFCARLTALPSGDGIVIVTVDN